MAAGHSTRNVFVVGLIPRSWTVLCQKLEAVGCAVFQWSAIGVVVAAHVGNRDSVQLKVEESDDQVTWLDRYVYPHALVPGGEVTFATYHVKKYVRVLGYSTYGGMLTVTVAQDEDQSLPALERHAVAATAYCATCESAGETGV